MSRFSYCIIWAAIITISREIDCCAAKGGRQRLQDEWEKKEGGIQMRIMTEQNLRDAFAGESQAHMKYLLYSDVAEKRAITMWPGF